MATKKILIVEDNKPLAEAMDVKLKKDGFETKVVFDGKQALDVINKENFDLIMLDLIMPEMDGFSFISEVKKRDIKVPIIVVTNLGSEDEGMSARKIGVDEYLIKSNITLDSLTEHVNDVLTRNK